MKPTEKDYTEQMRQLNEEWQKNMKIQRAMLIEKACAWLCTHCECIHCEFDDEGNCPKLRVFRQFIDKEWKQ